MSKQVQKTSTAALATIANLQAGLANVTKSIKTPNSEPYMRMGTDGLWIYGAENIEVEDGSLWAIDPRSLMHGSVMWTDYDRDEKKSNRVVGEIMVSMSEPRPSAADLVPYGDEAREAEDRGWRWADQLSIHLACVTGEDAGKQVLFKTTSVGGTTEIKRLIDEISKQLSNDPSAPVPCVELGNDHYAHKTYGKTYTPVMSIREWAPLDATEFSEPDDGEEEEVAEAEAEEQPKARTRKAAAPAKTIEHDDDEAPKTGRRRRR